MKEKWTMVQNQLSDKVELVAVSKTRPNSQIMDLYGLGQRRFGENRVQELTQKYEDLPKDIQWHFIGPLQRNKVKYIAPFVALIHSGDRPSLLKEINKQARKQERLQDVLLQFKIAEEDSKQGFSLAEAEKFLSSESYGRLSHIRICGVMGMATLTDNEEQVRQEFKNLKDIFEHLSRNYFPEAEHFKEISMGMSGDYGIALEEGSTLLRIGSLLFPQV